MDDRQTHDMDNGLNDVNSVNPSVNVPEEDLTNIFNTPVDETSTNLGVGETSSNYSNEIGEETEVLDIEEPLTIDSSSAFKEIDSAVSMEVTDDSVEQVTTDSTTNNISEPSILESTSFGMTDTVTTDSENTVSENTANEVPTGMQPNVMNNVDLNPIDLPGSGTEPRTEEPMQPAGNQDFLINQDPPLVPPTLNSGVENNNMEKPKKKNKFILPVIIVIALLAILAILYFVFFTGPKKVFDTAISKSFDYLRENVVTSMDYDTVSGKGSLSYEITATDQSMQAVFDMFNGIALDYEYAVDYKNKLMSFDLHSTYNSDNLIDASIYGENSKMYILLKDVYAKYISSDVEGYDNLFNTTNNKNELKTILNSAERALTKALIKDDFVKSEETIKIDGKDVKVTKNALVFTNANFNRISRSILTTLKDDADFISAVNKISDDENVDTKAALEDAISEIGEVDPDDKTVITVAIYTEGLLNDVVKVGIEMKDENDTLSASVTETTENNYALVATQNNEDVLTGTIKTNITKGDKNVSNDMEVSISVPNTVNVKVNMKSSVAYDTTFNKVDTTNSVDYNLLTEADVNAIGTKLMTNEGLVNLINNFNAMFGGMTNSGTGLPSNYNYDYNV